MIEIVGARPSHVGTIAARMRPGDVIECQIAGMSPKDALRNGIMGSTIAWTAKVDGRAEAMFGVVPISLAEGRGRVWMLGTTEVEKHPKALLRLGWIYTQACQRDYPTLENVVPANSDKVLRWLTRLGFAIGPVDVYKGHPIRGFIRSR